MVKGLVKMVGTMEQETAVAAEVEGWHGEMALLLAAWLQSRWRVQEEEAVAVTQMVVRLSLWRYEWEALGGQMAEMAQRPRCTGTEEWRRGGVVLYVRHGVDQACPLHGEPAPGKRLVTYVGVKEKRIAAAQEAMARQARYVAVQQRRGWLQRRIVALAQGLVALAGELR